MQEPPFARTQVAIQELLHQRMAKTIPRKQLLADFGFAFFLDQVMALVQFAGEVLE